MGRIYRALFPIPPQTVDGMLLWQAATLLRRPEASDEGLEEAEMVPSPATREDMAARIRRYATHTGDDELVDRVADI